MRNKAHHAGQAGTESSHTLTCTAMSFVGRDSVSAHHFRMKAIIALVMRRMGENKKGILAKPPRSRSSVCEVVGREGIEPSTY